MQFLYSQDLSNCTTQHIQHLGLILFLYSQDLSNCTTFFAELNKVYQVFVLSRFK